MPTDNPRIQVMLDLETSRLLSRMASQMDRSVSATAADLIREALELHEDAMLSKRGDARMRQTKSWVSHDQVWK